MCGGSVGLGGLGAVGTGAVAGIGGGIGAGASVAGFEIWPPVSGGDPPAPFAGGSTCGEEDGNSSAMNTQPVTPRIAFLAPLLRRFLFFFLRHTRNLIESVAHIFAANQFGKP